MCLQIIVPVLRKWHFRTNSPNLRPVAKFKAHVTSPYLGLSDSAKRTSETSASLAREYVRRYAGETQHRRRSVRFRWEETRSCPCLSSRAADRPDRRRLPPGTCLSHPPIHLLSRLTQRL